MRDVEGVALLDHCQAGLAVTFIMGGNFLWCAGMKKAQSPVKNFGHKRLAGINHENNIFANSGLIRQRFAGGIWTWQAGFQGKHYRLLVQLAHRHAEQGGYVSVCRLSPGPNKSSQAGP